MEREQGKRMGLKEEFLTRIPNKYRGLLFRSGIRRILNTTKIEAPTPLNEFWKQIVELYQQGFAFVIAANHTSHSDALPAAKIGNDIASVVNQYASDKNRLKGFVMPFAKSITGNQGMMLKIFYEESEPIFEELGTTPVPTATEGDKAKKRAEANPVSYTRGMIKGVKEGKEVIILPEGRVEGGRRDANGQRKGMQEFAEEALSISLRIAMTDKDKVAVIPVGISGGYNVYDPHTESLTWDSILVGLGVKNKTLFTAKVGAPILFEKAEIRTMDPAVLDNKIAEQIAALLPETERPRYTFLRIKL